MTDETTATPCVRYVTFGVQYAHTEHPTFPQAHPDGYVTVTAPTYPIARALIVAAFGKAWAFDYNLPPGEQYAPRGEIARITFEPTRAEA